MKSKQVNKDETKPVRLDIGWHKILKVDAAKAGTTIRELLESCLAESYDQIIQDRGL